MTPLVPRHSRSPSIGVTATAALLVKFLLDNIALIAIALTSGGLLLWPLVRKSGGSTALGPVAATQLINHRNAIVVDVREGKDFALGSLAGARNLPLATLKDRAGELIRFKSRPLLILCDAGPQSARAITEFKAQGFDEAYSLAGGVAAWKQAGLPLVVAGRDAGRSGGREPQRKSRNENRTGDRNRSRKASRVDSPAVGLASSAAPGTGVAVPAVIQSETVDGASSPSRVTELS